jgi:hypothetical protein
LLLEEIDKLKAGDFSDDLLPSVVNNLKLQYYNALESNRARARMFVNAFINGTPWEQEVKALDRVAGITKEQIVAFANRYFVNNYVTVFKKQGVDPTIKKIDKPAITPIPTNRDYVSQFVKDIQNLEVKPIQPRFVDFQKDLTFGHINDQLPTIYVQNKENGRFQLAFRYEFGNEADLRYGYAAQYLDYLGTDSLTSEQIKQQFFLRIVHFCACQGEEPGRSAGYGLRFAVAAFQERKEKVPPWKEAGEGGIPAPKLLCTSPSATSS